VNRHFWLVIITAILISGLSASEIRLQPGGNIWVGTSVQFTAVNASLNVNGVTFSWDLGDASPQQNGQTISHVYKDPGTYQVRCTFSTGLVLERSLQVQERRSIQVNPASPQAGEDTRFQPHQFGGNQIRWDFGDGTVESAAGAVTHAFTNSGPVTVKAYDFNGQSSIAVEVIVNVQADTRTLEIAGGSPKAHMPVQFNATGFGSGNLRWNFGDGTITLGGVAMQHTYNNPGNYTVVVRVDGSSNTKELVVNVAPDPRNLNVTPSNPGLFENVTLQAQGFPGGSLEWTFGDGESQTGGQQVTHAYKRLGQFQVSVKAAGSADPPVTAQVRVNQDRRRIQVQPAQARVGDMVRLKLLNVDQNLVDWKIGESMLQSRSAEITHRVLDPGDISVTCTITDQTPVTTRLTVRDYRSIESSPGTVFAGSEVYLQLKNGLGPAVLWEFSDGVKKKDNLRMKRVFPRAGQILVKAFDANGEAKVPVSQRIQVLDDNRTIESVYAKHFVGVDVDVVARGFRDNTVEWDFGDGRKILGPTRMTHKYNAPGMFRIHAVDFRGRDGKTIDLQIQVSDDNRSIKAPGSIRSGDPVTLELSGVQGGQFQWDLGSAGRNSGLIARNVTFPAAGRIPIRITDNSDTYPPFSAFLMVQPDNREIKAPKFALPGDKVSLEAANFDGPKVAWNFGDGHQQVLSGKAATHTFAKTGNYRITASDDGGTSDKAFTKTLRVVELAPEFTLQRMELAFSTGKAYMVVPRKSAPPSYALRLMSTGRGVLKGRWILDDQVMGMFSMLLKDGQVADMKRSQMPRLPVMDVGLHTLSVEFTNYRFSGRTPYLRYFVSAGGAILLVSPESGEKISSQGKVVLKWKPVRRATQYETAISQIPFQFLSEKKIPWKAVKKKDHLVLDMKSLKKGDWIYWMVRGKNDSDRVITTSEIGSFREQ